MEIKKSALTDNRQTVSKPQPVIHIGTTIVTREQPEQALNKIKEYLAEEFRKQLLEKMDSNSNILGIFIKERGGEYTIKANIRLLTSEKSWMPYITRQIT